MTNEYNKEGEFLAFVGYEAHSMEHGDHVALNYDLDAPLVECTSIEDWKRKARGHKVLLLRIIWDIRQAIADTIGTSLRKETRPRL